MQRPTKTKHLTNERYSVIMLLLPDFPITRPGRFSDYFIERHVASFHEVVRYLERLPYQRLNDPRDYELVLSEGGGTFTARHAILTQLANEQQVTGLALALCVYDLSGDHWTEVGNVLGQYGLHRLPEVCGCIKYRKQFYSLEDVTAAKSGVVSAVDIVPVQIGNFKRRYHSNYLANWATLENTGQSWSVAQLWSIRDQCLSALAQQWNHQRSSVS